VSKIHIGKKIKEVAKKLKVGPTKLGDIIGMSRDGVYKVYRKDYIDTTLLRKFSEALKHDFFKDLSEGLTVADPEESMGFATKSEVKHVEQKVDALSKKIEKFIELFPQMMNNTYDTKRGKSLGRGKKS
jgi:hypothetical protein